MVTEIRYLGLMIDESLNWQSHLNKIKDKIIPMIPIIYKCRNYLSDRTKMNIYNAFFLSHLRYLLPVWGTCCVTRFNKIKILQNKVLKTLFNYDILGYPVW